MTEKMDYLVDTVPGKKNQPKRRKIAEKRVETKISQIPADMSPTQTKKKNEFHAIEDSTRSGERSTEKPDHPHKAVPEQFLNDLALFANILEKTPALLNPIREVLEYHLMDPIDRKTFPRMVNAMSMLLGPSATMVVMTACHVNSAAFFEDLLYATKDEKDQDAIQIIQHLTAIYGNRVQKAYALSSGTMDEDWYTVDVNTYKREGENAHWIVDVKIILYSGKENQIKMTPDSIFQIVEIFATELGKNIPIENVDPNLVKKCEDNFTTFYEKFYGSKKSEKTENSDGEEKHPIGYA
jgi:hypothetical protein